jgi:hypothetical protein
MSIRPIREFGNIRAYSITCDDGKRSHGEDIEARTFIEVRQEMNKSGWRTQRRTNPKTGKPYWHHTCPDCLKPFGISSKPKPIGVN